MPMVTTTLPSADPEFANAYDPVATGAVGTAHAVYGVDAAEGTLYPAAFCAMERR
jgi:hypothetical protein